MLPKENRLRLKRDFQRVFTLGTRVDYGYFHALVYKREEQDKDVSRIGVVVGKKVDKLAVNRNRIKRRQREALRKYIKDLPLGFDIIIFPHNNVLKCNFDSLLRATKKFISDLEYMGKD